MNTSEVNIATSLTPGIGVAGGWNEHPLRGLVVIGIVLTLSGCATPPQWLANHYNSQDPCQRQNYQGQQPNWCGASQGRTYIYKGQGGAPIGYLQR